MWNQDSRRLSPNRWPRAVIKHEQASESCMMVVDLAVSERGSRPLGRYSKGRLVCRIRMHCLDHAAELINYIAVRFFCLGDRKDGGAGLSRLQKK